MQFGAMKDVSSPDSAGILQNGLPQEGRMEPGGDGETQLGQETFSQLNNRDQFKRERNRLHARESRERKKRSFEVLQQRCTYFEQLSVSLKDAIVKCVRPEESVNIFQMCSALMSNESPPCPSPMSAQSPSPKHHTKSPSPKCLPQMNAIPQMYAAAPAVPAVTAAQAASAPPAPPAPPAAAAAQPVQNEVGLGIESIHPLYLVHIHARRNIKKTA